MTVNELLIEEMALGFANTLELNATFLGAVNRAVREICNEDGEKKRLRILKNSPKPIKNIKKLVFNGDGEERITVFGKTLYFKLSGKGSYQINDTGEEKPFEISFGVVKMHINPGDTLIFKGDVAYTVFDITVFKDRLDLNDLPTDPLVPYDINSLTDDFLSFSGTLRDERGFEIKDAQLSGSTVYIPREINGEFEVSYKRAAPTLTLDDGESEIDIPKEYLPLLPLLVAGYLWLDDEPEKAQYYTSLYKEGLQRTKYYKGFSSPSKYNDVLGWA